MGRGGRGTRELKKDLSGTVSRGNYPLEAKEGSRVNLELGEPDRHISRIPQRSPEHSIDETFEWMRGQCAAWATAFADRYPSLRFAIQYRQLSDEEAEQEMSEDGVEYDGETIWQAEHVLAHDESFAYDAEGAHRLPLEDPEWETEYDCDYQDVEGTGLLEYGYQERAKEWIEESGYLELAAAS